MFYMGEKKGGDDEKNEYYDFMMVRMGMCSSKISVVFRFAY
jgi:hypothetical protein